MVSIRWAPVLSLPAGFKEVWQASETRTLLPVQAVIVVPEKWQVTSFFAFTLETFTFRNLF